MSTEKKSETTKAQSKASVANSAIKTTTKNAPELTDKELGGVTGGITVTKVIDASSPDLFLKK
jgi:hypothetical protein